MKKKLIFALKIALGISLIVAIIYSIYQWPWKAIPIIIMLSMVVAHWEKEYWGIALVFFLTTFLACIGGTVMIYVIHFIFTGKFFIEAHSLWSIGWLFTTIYAFGLVVEEDQRAPYIWLWRQAKGITKIKLSLC